MLGEAQILSEEIRCDHNTTIDPRCEKLFIKQEVISILPLAIAVLVLGMSTVIILRIKDAQRA